MTGAALVLLQGGLAPDAAPVACLRPRVADCRCDGKHRSATRQLHICAVPGCRVIWNNDGEIVQIS